MSLLDDFFNTSADEIDALMGTRTMVCNGETFSVVWDDFSADTDGGMGGLEPEIQAIATAQPADVTDPLAMKNKRCTINGQAFRVYAVRIGPVAVRFDLCDVNESK